MSLNRCEQRTLEFVEAHKEERQFWQDKVRSTAAGAPDPYTASLRIEADLWAYYVERSAVAEPFRSAVRAEGLRRTSMRNLAEYWIRLWTPPRAQKSAETRSGGSKYA